MIMYAVICGQVDTNSSHFYLFTYFLNETAGARLALSSDGINWQLVNNETPIFTPTLSPERLMRDPMIAFDPTTRTFHVVWTSGWSQTGIGYSSSKDLKTWTAQTALPVGAAITNCKCCWAPEIFYDDSRNKFMIFWSTDNGAGKRTYYSLTSDFKSFTDAAKLFDPGYTEIDACMLKVAEAKYYMFFKDERSTQDDGQAAKNIHYVCGATPQGPWGAVSKPITKTGYEGPTAIKINDEYRVYIDPFTNSGSTDRMVKVKNLDTTASPWPYGDKLYKVSASGVKNSFSFSHGSIIEIPREYVMFLLYNISLPKESSLRQPLLPARRMERENFTLSGIFDVLGRNVMISNTVQGRLLHSGVSSGFFIMMNDDKKAKPLLSIEK
jgi:hypothetical protein